MYEHGFLKLWGPLLKIEVEILKGKRFRAGDHDIEYCGMILGEEGRKVLLFLLPILAVQAGNMKLHGIYLEPTGRARGEYFRRGQFSSFGKPTVAGSKNYFNHLIKINMTIDAEDYEDIDEKKTLYNDLITIV